MRGKRVSTVKTNPTSPSLTQLSHQKSKSCPFLVHCHCVSGLSVTFNFCFHIGPSLRCRKPRPVFIKSPPMITYLSTGFMCPFKIKANCVSVRWKWPFQRGKNRQLSAGQSSQCFFICIILEFPTAQGNEQHEEHKRTPGRNTYLWRDQRAEAFYKRLFLSRFAHSCGTWATHKRFESKIATVEAQWVRIPSPCQ